MTAILQDDGELLVPSGACVAAERVRPGDPRYEALLADSIPVAALRGSTEEDAALAARFELHYWQGHPRSA
jgi:hypothetical protein